MVNTSILTVDLSCFFNEGHEDDKKKAREIISHAPMHVLNMDSFRLSHLPLPGGFDRPPEQLANKNEYFTIFHPESGSNLYPNDLPEFREVTEQIFHQFTETGLLVETIVNDCFGLPPKFLQEYNNDRNWDSLVALRYLPATDIGNTGLGAHQDANVLTFLFQDQVGGLEVLKDRGWIPIVPTEGSIIVNLGDVVQVLSNNKFKSAIHRVVRPEGKFRHSYGFFYTLEGNKWVEPSPSITEDIGVPAQYRGFFYKDYQQLRIRNKTHLHSRPEDVIHITHYAITS
ncbi:hypothetical protein IFM89_001269 [Coptis chinensis]|uniref:Fe2OG dioxygenase domain-containing protein n=1 Tax=Coptis chinensis TaxID=261450 RepID=A0A835H105_9MAGN|nr:hypothetical protein IFM89_001269 [Coptis chinensis]